VVWLYKFGQKYACFWWRFTGFSSEAVFCHIGKELKQTCRFNSMRHCKIINDTFLKVSIKWFRIFQFSNCENHLVPPRDRRDAKQIRVNAGFNFSNELRSKSRMFIYALKKTVYCFLGKYLQCSLVRDHVYDTLPSIILYIKNPT
jgi:hypothetical protein